MDERIVERFSAISLSVILSHIASFSKVEASFVPRYCFEAAIRSRFLGVACQLVDTLTTLAIEVDKGTAIVVIRFLSS